MSDKASLYNFLFPEDDAHWLAYNALRGGLARLDQPGFDNLQRALKGEGESLDTRQLAEFRRGGFIVPQDYPELSQVQLLFDQGRYHPHLSLTIVPTLDCNFACPYCYERKNPGYMREDTLAALVRFTDQRLAQLRPRLFQVTWYGGEPLLAPAVLENLIEEFLNLCQKHNTGITSGLISNCSLLDEANYQLLKRANLGFVQVTIDGDEETHNLQRPLRGRGPSYQIVVKNIDRLVGRVPVGVRMNILRPSSSPEQIRSALLRLKERGWFESGQKTVLGFGLVQPYTDFCGGPAEDYLDPGVFSRICLAANRIALELDIPTTIYPTPASACTALAVNSYCVGPEGEVYKCWSSIGNPAEILGNIRVPDTLHANSELLRWLSWSPFKRQKCRRCPHLPICLGGCPYIARGKMKPLSPDGPRCRADIGECQLGEILRLSVLQLARRNKTAVSGPDESLNNFPQSHLPLDPETTTREVQIPRQ